MSAIQPRDHHAVTAHPAADGILNFVHWQRYLDFLPLNSSKTTEYRVLFQITRITEAHEAFQFPSDVATKAITQNCKKTLFYRAVSVITMGCGQCLTLPETTQDTTQMEYCQPRRLTRALTSRVFLRGNHVGMADHLQGRP